MWGEVKAGAIIEDHISAKKLYIKTRYILFKGTSNAIFAIF